MSKIPVILLIATLNLGFLAVYSYSSSSFDHHYRVGDAVPFLANKVGPLNNPSETYEYFDLPFCSPDKSIRRRESLADALNGGPLTNARYDIKFREDKVAKILCDKTIGREEVSKFRDAVQRDFYFQMYYDDLPFWGFIGKVEQESFTPYKKGSRSYLFTHVQFDFLYNGNHVVEVQAFSDPNHVVDITEDAEIDVQFTYSAIWNSTSTQFANRMNRYSRASFLSPIQQLHWFSVTNSIVIAMLSLGLIAVLYWWNVNSDLRKYSTGEEDDKEVGWTSIDGGAFKCPTFLSLFCAVIGCGTQIFLVVFCLFVLMSLGLLDPYTRGTVLTALAVVYIITSPVAGYTAALFHCQFAETGWGRSIFLTGILFTGPLLLVLSILNTVAISNGAKSSLPFGTIFLMFIVYGFVAVPILVLGGIVGRCHCHRNSIPSSKRCFREIPSVSWYRKIHGQMFLGGLLPFSGILVELHLFYASLWGYKLFTLPSILFITFSILVLLTAVISVGLTYIQLSMEDTQWWWRSVLRGGSTAVFMFVYSIYFYARSDMSGLMQSAFFLGYNACICYAFFLMLGAISFGSSLLFINRAYYAVKSE